MMNDGVIPIRALHRFLKFPCKNPKVHDKLIDNNSHQKNLNTELGMFEPKFMKDSMLIEYTTLDKAVKENAITNADRKYVDAFLSLRSMIIIGNVFIREAKKPQKILAVIRPVWKFPIKSQGLPSR